MVVRNNVPALNSHRNLMINNSSLARNLEKLSSGFRINRAADDAAGLAISERMRGQIRGLAMSEQNTSQGINLIQTAEGGLQETQNILQRIRELAVMAANGTFQQGDREQINHEVVALIDEIDRIASSTHYNGINLLDGSFGSVAVTDPANVLGLALDSLMMTSEGRDLLAGMTDLNSRITVTEMFGRDPITGAQTSQMVASLQIGDRTYVGQESIKMLLAGSAAVNAAGSGAINLTDANALAKAVNAILGNPATGGNTMRLHDGTEWTVSGVAADITYADRNTDDFNAWLSSTIGSALSHLGSGFTFDATVGTDFNEALSSAIVNFIGLNPGLDTPAALGQIVTALNTVHGIDITSIVNDPASGLVVTVDAATSEENVTVRFLADQINQVLADRGFAAADRINVTTLTDATSLQNALNNALNGANLNTAELATLTALLGAIDGVTDLGAPTTDASNATAATAGNADGVVADILTWLNDSTNEITQAQADQIAELLAAHGRTLTFDTFRNEAGITFFDYDGKAIATIELAGNLNAGVISNVALIASTPGGSDVELRTGTATVAAREAQASQLTFQIGANGGQDQRASLRVANMNAGALGFVDAFGKSWTIRDMAASVVNGEAVSESNHGISIRTGNGANAAIDVIDAALDAVSGQRAQLGAMQNRLESTMNSLGVARENLTAAESNIRDVDMAAEMMAFTQNNILSQAAQAMLAQANQLPQGVLQLLR